MEVLREDLGVLKAVFFCEKMAIWDSESPPRASGRAQGCFVSEKWQSGIPDANSRHLEALRENPGVVKAFSFLTNGNP